MRRLLLLAVITVTALPTQLSANAKSYDVVPYSNFVAQTTIAGTDVIQYVRNTLDSLSVLSVWIGDTFDTSSFNVEVRDSATPSLRIAYNAQPVHAAKCWAWLDFPLTKDAQPIRGRTYKVVVSRTGGGGISFAYDPTNPYRYGKAVANGSSPSLDSFADIALRVIGLHDTVSDVWRACSNHGDDPRPGGQGAEIALAKAKSMGVKWLRDDFLTWDGWEEDRPKVESIYNRYVDSGFSLIGNLSFGRNVESISSGPPGAGSLGCYPPRNLYADVHDDTNWWAGYCRGIMGSLDSVKYWEVFPEAHGDWFWKDPDIRWYHGGGVNDTTDSIDTPRERCSLYMRMCVVAESVAQELGGSQKILGGGTSRVLDWGINDSTGDTVWVSGGAWLRLMFDLAERYGGVENCFDIVSLHAYMHYDWGYYFIEDVFDRSLDTARSVMREAGYPGMELWATEYGWPRWNKIWGDPPPPPTPVTDSFMQARNISQFYTSAIARQADPRGGYDRAIHYELTSYHVPWNWENDGWGFLDSVVDQPLMPQGWAFKQTAEQLTGKRLNGRVMTGDTGTDSLVRMYEFEDPATSKKTWVCWRSDGGSQDATVQLPTRADSAYLEALAYEEGTPPNQMRQANSYGWLSIGAADRPQFVTEPASMPISRPDLVVDRILVPAGAKVGSVMDIHAIVKNVGDTITPDTVALDFLSDDSVFRHATSEWPIAPGDSYDFSFEINPIPYWMHGWHLFSARVNPGQTYVEKDGMDDNCGYARRYISYAPGGDIRGVVCGGHSNSPLPLFGLETHSYEVDTLGSVPAESARMVQWAYHVGDTVPYGGDTTAWFDASAAVALDTSWLYLFGQGRYSAYLQVKDSWSMSDLIPDTTHQYVIFDTTGPTGSVVINSGDRFTTSSACTLALTANDSASGIAAMRFINDVPKADLVVGGSFTATAGSWQYENGEVDTLLHMARLSATPVEAMVRQFIPAESISAHAGDSCALEASILAHVHEDSATGGVSFWYYSTRVDSLNFHDTLFTLVDSARFSGNLLSLTGRYNLSKRFLLSPPNSDSEWVWKGGMVRVEAVAENGSGSVWTDNVALNTFAPESGYVWWGQYDTLAVWDITSGAGMKVVRALFMDSAGNVNATPSADTIIFDPTAPVVNISVPGIGQMINGTAEVTGWSYDPVEVSGDTWFQRRMLSYRLSDSTNWLPVLPDSCSDVPAYPDSQQILGPAVHLGYWNTLSVPNGQYYLKLTATDSAGHVSSCSTWVMVFHGGGGGMGNGPEGGGSGLGEGSVFVGSATGTVLHLSDALDSLDAYSVSDSGSQARVTAILEVGNDSLLVLDAANKRIHKLHKSGQHRRRLVSGLSQPADLKRDDNGNLWLADRGWNRIGKFRSNGTLVFVRGGLGADSLHFDAPEGIAVKGSLVYVADGGNDRICVWDTSGNFKTTITGDFENPTAVYVTDEGTIYLTDGSDGKLKGITPLGGSIVALGTEDSSQLKGLVPSENRHSLFSLAPVPNKVYKLRIMSDDNLPGGQQSAGKVNLPKTLSLAQPFPNPARTRLNIAYALPRQTRVVLKLYDVAGKLVNTLANGEQKPGYYSLTWNRQDTKGRSCAGGVYLCTLTAENQRFCRKVILTE